MFIVVSLNFLFNYLLSLFWIFIDDLLNTDSRISGNNEGNVLQT